MLYLMIGLFVAVAVGALLNQRQARKRAAPAPETPGTPGTPVPGTPGTPEASAPGTPEAPVPETPGAAGATVPASGASDGLPVLHEEIAPLDPTLAAKPLSSPNAVASATYATAAGQGDDSPYGYGTTEEPKKKPAANLLRWCGRSSSLQVGDFLIPSPVAYWCNGPCSVQEPSRIDLSLPVAYPKEGEPLPADGAASYAEMTPLQRGIYLTWLAGGRIQPPLHLCYPSLWLYGLERRVIADRLDLGLCISEAFRLLPLMRWEAMLSSLIRFITWLAIKIWLPEDELLNFCKKLPTVPEELLGMLLGSYANSQLPLPSAVAFTLMRTSARLRVLALGEDAQEIPHSNDALQKFTPVYKDVCSGGLVLPKPKSSLSLTYTPTNPTLAGLSPKNGGTGGLVELPNFFEDLSVFEPLINLWKDFVPRDFVPSLQPPEPETAAEALEERPDFEAFIHTLRPAGSEAPLIATLANLGKLMNLNPDDPQSKPRGKERKGMVEMAQVEGWQIVPNLGISGREYRWDDKVLFLPLELGAILPPAYLVSSFLLEFLCALMETREQRIFELLRQRLNDYFTSLTTEDNVRLEAQSQISLPPQHEAGYYGEIIQFWLQEGDRRTLGDFLLDFLSFLPEVQEAGIEPLKARVHSVLALVADTALTPVPAGDGGKAEPANETAEKTPPERGGEILALLSPKIP